MSPLVAASVIFASFVLQTYGQNECDTYIVTVTQGNYFEDDIRLHCKFNDSVDYTIMSWQTRNSTSAYRQAFTVYKDFPTDSGPEAEFLTKLNGTLDGNNHTLTILNAKATDGLDYWLCRVITENCTSGVQDEWNLNLKEAEWIVELYTDNTLIDQISSNTTTSGNGYNQVDNSIDPIYSKKDVNVTCVSKSDRKPVALRIENVKTDSANCLPVDGPYPQPWSCSVTGILSKGFTLKKESSDVFCEVEFNSEPPIATNKQFIIIMELRLGEIFFFVFLALIGMSCLGILIYCKISKKDGLVYV